VSIIPVSASDVNSSIRNGAAKRMDWAAHLFKPTLLRYSDEHGTLVPPGDVVRGGIDALGIILLGHVWALLS